MGTTPEWWVNASDVDGAREKIFRHLQQLDDQRIIYLHGWSGFGASAVLRSIAEVLPFRRNIPELCFDIIIQIDCSEWKSRRAMQRVIAEELKLDRSVMAILDKQDEVDDFQGVDESSRDEIRRVSRAIHQVLKDSTFVVIFHNGSDGEIDLKSFGVPLGMFSNCGVIWTFRKRHMTIKPHDELVGKLRNTNLLAYDRTMYLSSEMFYALLCNVAAIVAANYPCMEGIDPAKVANCSLYALLLHYNFHSTTKSAWAAHASNYWICDGIIQEDIAREISNALHRLIRWECDASLLDVLLKKFMKHLGPSFLVVKDDDVYEEGSYRWISITSRDTKVDGIQTIPATTSSFFLAFERSEHPPAALPNGLFEHSSKLAVLILCCCAFSFASPPFVKCHNIRFLGLDHCTDDKTGEGEDHTEWTACLYSLWVLDLRYTDWNEILSQEKIDLMANIRELNIEGVRCWQYTTHLEGRVSNLQRLRITKPTCGPETSTDTSNSFLDKTKLEILDLSGNSEMEILPDSLSKASSLQVLVLDGCNGLENVIVHEGLPHLLRSFSFDGYGPASHWTPTIELPPRKLRPSIVTEQKDVKTSKISLEGCTQLENLFLRGLPYLVELDLSGTAIKILDFRTMVVEVPGLKRLFLLGCDRLRAIRWDTHYPRIHPELELLCIDTRAGLGCPRPSFDQNKSFKLQVHAVVADARLARSLWDPIYYSASLGGHVYINIRVTSSPVCSSAVQLEAIGKEKIVPASPYGDVLTMVGDAPMQAFPQPRTPRLDRHIEIAQGSHSLESELQHTSRGWNLAVVMGLYAESLHVHDASTGASLSARGWGCLRWCRVERCRELDTVFPSDSYGFGKLETFWASDLLMARWIWGKGSRDLDNVGSFGNLQHLHLRSCPRLQFVLPVWVASFPSLQTLHIIHCGDLRHVFVLDGRYPREIAVRGVQFPELTTIHLHDLPTLRQICEVKMVAPALETIKIRGCWSLRRLPAVKARGRGEKKPAVEIERDVWDALEWDGEELHRDLFEAPVHSRYYKEKLPRVSFLR